jgi:hypothetical protein
MVCKSFVGVEQGGKRRQDEKEHKVWKQVWGKDGR